MSKWNHAICEADWIIERGNWQPLPDGHKALVSVERPVLIRGDEPSSVERCCFCGKPTIFGAFVRQDPATLSCHGDHRYEDEE